ncbi:MAG: WD40 repeat domain-containing protein [Lachnospiraceae bacterium]|nr:WD40 repeat domain-containing protein [Lachnospiraceae bacterium]
MDIKNRNFWGYYDNGIYRVGCTGGSVYVYNQENQKLARFQDMRYVYAGVFMPNTNIFVAKSTEGILAVYDLDRLELVKKIVITRIGAQDEGFAFSPDGKYFYNIEKPKSSLRTQLTKYDTSDFHVAETLFAGRKELFLCEIEFEQTTENGYILGYMRDDKDLCKYNFVAQFIEDEIVNIKRLAEEVFWYALAYKGWERSGFTKKAFASSSGLVNWKEKGAVSLRELFEKACDLEGE